MIITQFILNVIWALLGIAIFIYSFIAIREQRRKTKFESLMLHFRYIEQHHEDARHLPQLRHEPGSRQPRQLHQETHK